MAQITHNISNPNDGNGDELRTAFDNQNQMNTELYENKVDKIPGQGLSENNYTTTEKDKLRGIEEGAQVNLPINYSDIVGAPELNNIAAYPDTKFDYVDSNNFTIPQNVQAISVRKNGAPTEVNVTDWSQLGNVITYNGVLEIGDYLIIGGVYVVPGSGGSGGGCITAECVESLPTFDNDLDAVSLPNYTPYKTSTGEIRYRLPSGVIESYWIDSEDWEDSEDWID